MSIFKRTLVVPPPREDALRKAQEMEKQARVMAWRSVRSMVAAADEFCELVKHENEEVGGEKK